MANKMIFQVYLAKQDLPSAAYAELDLPASPWELVDASDKIRLQKDEKLYMEVTDYYDFENLAPYLDSINPSLNELNVLAEQLSRLEGNEQAAFHGLLQIKVDQRPPKITMQDLRNFAASVDCCRVIAGVRNDTELGRFYAENDFVPEINSLPDAVLKLLDYSLIGQKMREAEGGVFTTNGYVLQDEDLKQAPPAPEQITRPGYTVLLEVSKGCFRDPTYDTERTILLELPADRYDMDQALEELGAASWHEVGWHCIDCQIPFLSNAIDQSGDIHQINQFAQGLCSMDQKDLLKYKAVLTATECKWLKDAMMIKDSLDQYVEDLRIASARDTALEELRNQMPSEGLDALLPFVDLHRYGQALLQNFNSVITEYGLVERKDTKQIQKISDSQIRGGMKMT